MPKSSSLKLVTSWSFPSLSGKLSGPVETLKHYPYHDFLHTLFFNLFVIFKGAIRPILKESTSSLVGIYAKLC